MLRPYCQTFQPPAGRYCCSLLLLLLRTDYDGDAQWGLVDYHRAFVWEGGWGREYPGEPYGLAYSWCTNLSPATSDRSGSHAQTGRTCMIPDLCMVAACTRVHSQ
jgi:hypothetical protein